MNKLLIWLLLLPGVAFSQKYGSYEPNQVARDTLELVDGINGAFIVSDTTILPLQIFYAQFSDDGINFHRKYAEGRDIWRISTDSQYNWDTIDFRGLTTSIDSIIENGYWVVMVDTSDTIRNTNKLTALGDGMDVTLSDKELRFAVTIPQTSELGYYFSRNVGTGVGTYDSTDNTTFNYRSISGDNYITVTLVGTDIVLTFDPTQLVIEDGVAMISDGFDSTGYAESNFNIPSLSPLSFSISEQFFAGYANATHNKLMLYRDNKECCYDYWLLKVCTPNEEVTQDTSYVIQLGYLYNWYAASDPRNMAPVGWRVPTYSDIVDLRYALDPSGSGGSNIAGGLMKEQGTLYWDSPNSLATNISGFNAKGAGYRSHLLGDYAGLKQTMSIWNTSYHFADDKGGTSALTYDTGIFFSSPAYADKKQGQSVRWVKENNINTGSVVGNDGKIYTTVKIGNQVWTSQNVMETKFRNGDVIPKVEDGFVWSTLMEPALSAYDNNDSIAGTPLYTGGGLDCTVDTVWNHEVIEFIAGDGIEILREDDRIIIRAFTNDTTVIPSGGEPGQIFIITDEGDPAWVDICEAIAPCIEEITNRIDTLTEIIIETRNKEYPICLAVHPYFNTVDSTTFTIGEVVADNHVINSYLIDWYKDGIIVFTTGDSIVHPFTLDVQAGTYTPQFRWINVDGYYYSPTKQSGYYYAPDLIDCLPSVTKEQTEICGYGLLYNWYAATDSRNIANDGWSVPSEDNLKTLADYLGAGGNYTSSNGVGAKIKETGTEYWESPNSNSTNEVGFNARGAGIRTYNTGSFTTIKVSAVFHSSQPNSGDSNRHASLRSTDDGMAITTGVGLATGKSIRLIKNTTTLSHGQTGTYVGNDGTVYQTICIGTQEWLAENLRETKYRNGDIIPEVTNNATWVGLTTGALCAYNNDWSNACMTKPSYYP